MPDLDLIHRRMGEDWDRRAAEDAPYYVAFGRRNQTREEFLASAADVLRELRQELRRFPKSSDFRSMAALEIGCGPGRLMLPLSEIFGSVAGVDVSQKMVELARLNLAGVPHARVSRSSGSDLRDFDDASIDFCYSYAVFQHIPSREVVLSYLSEACRVLKPGGVLKCQVNSLPGGDASAEAPVVGWSLRSGAPPRVEQASHEPDTWSGVRFSGEEIAGFALQHDLQLLSMDGFDTQYLWFAARKGRPAGSASDGARTRIVGVGNTATNDRLVPQAGRFASASLWVADLPERADLNNLRVEIDGERTAPAYVGRRDRVGSGQVNVFLPPGVRTGALPVRMLLDGKPLGAPAALRVIAAPPSIPRLLSVSDGVNLLSDLSIESRSLKIHLEDVPLGSTQEVLTQFEARLDDRRIEEADAFCVDPLARRWELNLKVPDDTPAGPYNLYCRLGRRRFRHVGLQITS